MGNHKTFSFSDLRARLEVAIDKVMALAKQQQEDNDRDTSDDYNSDSEEVSLDLRFDTSKTFLLWFPPDPTQTALYSRRRKPEV